MRKLTGSEIRSLWIKFFESKGHKWLPGVNLIPQGDKSLLWVNAGVTGLKKYFDGTEVPPCRRIVNVQKSIRTNDIENVGHTARHHTFFEMLGNFSIGDYFRSEVIPWAVEWLTGEQWLAFPKEKIYITYNPADLDSYRLWQACGIAKDHLIPLEGNFWMIGEGPCGPDTEIFFDRGEDYDPKHIGIRLLAEDMENDRYVEIWNIVFSQYNAVNGVERKDYKELPSKNIDTGSGLERLACVCQGTETNFETDLFTPIIEATKAICGVPYEGANKMSYRVIADHARCLTFALSDGAYFSNEGRGYVLRRLIRRAMRYGQKLGIHEPFMFKLIGLVAEKYSDYYPELRSHAEFVSKMVKGEEEKFLKTLTEGEEILKSKMEGKEILDGETVFRLYDTYGFPPDMTVEICEESGVKADMEGFAKLMEQQKERARAARGDIESFHKQSKDLLAFNEKSTFRYDVRSIEATVIGTFQNGEKVDSIAEEGDVAVSETPFYAEMGGQVSDTGVLENGSFSAEVSSVSKAPAGQHLHHIHVSYGEIKVGDKVRLTIDGRRRSLIERNHSATHLMHAALCEVLGTHVDQKGSYVDENYLRFDFSSLTRLSYDQLRSIETKVNEKILESIEEVTEVLPIEEAKKRGAEMEFAEKYGDVVRVVEFGDYSREFCGGTHVRNSAEIGLFVIESEGSVASGIRRIQGRTSIGAIEYLANKRAVLSDVESSLGSNDADSLTHVRSLKDEISAMGKEIASLKDKIASASAKNLGEEFVEVNGIHLLCKKVDGAQRNDLMNLGDNLKGKYEDSLLLLVGTGAGMPVVVFATGKAAKRVGAGALMKAVAPILGGNGGGRPEMASGSAKDLSRLEEAFEAAREKLK